MKSECIRVRNLFRGFNGKNVLDGIDLDAVSYTHLTLPTIA